MSVVTRHLVNTGDPVIGTDGTAKAGVQIIFRLVDEAKLQPVTLFDAATDGGELVIGDDITVTTDSAGFFAVDLWPNDRGELATVYKVIYPAGVAGGPAKPFYIRVTSGTEDLTLVTAKTAFQAIQPQTLSLFDQLLANIIQVVGTATALVTTTANGLMSYVDKKILNLLGTKEIDLRTYMDGQSGRPTLATWQAAQATTDVTGVVQAALAAAQTTGSCIAPLAGTLAISQKIVIGNGTTTTLSTIHNGLKFIMAGMGFADAHFPGNAGGTVFKWIGGAADYMFEIAGPISGLEFGKFDCDCNGVALGGLAAYHPFSSKFRQINVRKWVGKDNGLTGANRVIDAGIVVEAMPQGTWGGTAGGRGSINNVWEQVMTNEPAVAGANGIRIGANVISQPEYDVLQNTFIDCRFTYQSGTDAVGSLQYTGASTSCTMSLHTSVGDQNLYIRSGSGEYYVFTLSSYATLSALKTAVEATGILGLTINSGHTGDSPLSILGFQSQNGMLPIPLNEVTTSSIGHGLILCHSDNNSFYNTILGGFGGVAPNPSLLLSPAFYTGPTQGAWVQNTYGVNFPCETGFFNCAIIGGLTTENGWNPSGGAGVYFFPYPVSDGEAVPSTPGIWGFTAAGAMFGTATSTKYLLANQGDATPPAGGLTLLQTSSSWAPTNITNFSGGTTGQVLTVLFSNPNTTLVYGANTIVTRDGLNYAGGTGQTITFVYSASGKWYEVARSSYGAATFNFLTGNNTTTLQSFQFTASSDSSVNGGVSLGGPKPAYANTYPGTRVFVVGDMALGNTNLIRWYDNVGNNGNGIRLNASNELEFYINSAVVAKMNASGISQGVDLSSVVPKTTTVNSHALSGNVTLAVGDIPGAVPNTTTVAGHALSSNVTLATADLTDIVAPTAWTPVLTFVTPGDLSTSYQTQFGSYTKKGKEVTITFSISLFTFTWTTASGDLHITGLPFAAKSTTGYAVEGNLRFQGITKAGYTNFTVEVAAAANYLRVIGCGSAQTIAPISAADMPSGGSISFIGSLTYCTD